MAKMRPKFFQELYKLMKKDQRVWALTGDLGYGGFDKIKQDFPERFINTGASEQAMMGIAVGLAQEGKIPFVYTITPFFMRAAETISIYLHHEGAPVLLVGSGRDDDYKHDGYSHDATLAQNFLNSLNIDLYYPDTEKAIPAMVKMMAKGNKPAFISLKR